MTYLWPDRPNDEYARAKYIWRWPAAAYLLVVAGLTLYRLV